MSLTPEEQELSDQLALDLRNALTEQFVGEMNSDATRTNIRTFLLNQLAQLSGDRKIARMPGIDVKVDGRTVNIELLDPDTGELLTEEGLIKLIRGY
jgi:hypothetical protein